MPRSWRRRSSRVSRVLATDLSGADVALTTPPPDNSAVRWRVLDVTSEDDWAEAAGWVESEWGGLDVLVNNAGVAGGGRIELTSMDDWRWIFEINLFLSLIHI